jgi:NADH-ubiquinone oxidoreductase chain 5
MIGSLALMGFPFTAGFYSKEAILEIAYSSYSVSGHFAYVLGVISAFFTAFYSMRVMYLTFLRLPAGYKSVYEHAHEPGLFMLIPLMVLSILSIIVGYILKDMFIGLGTTFWGNSLAISSLGIVGSFYEAEFISWNVKLVPFVVSILGVIVSFLSYHFGSSLFINYLNYYWFRKMYIFFSKKWFFDLVYNQYLVRGFFVLSYDVLYKMVDRGLLEYFGASGMYYFTLNLFENLRLLQTGFLNVYIVSLFACMLFALVLLYFLNISFDVFFDVFTIIFIVIVFFLFLDRKNVK